MDRLTPIVERLLKQERSYQPNTSVDLVKARRNYAEGHCIETTMKNIYTALLRLQSPKMSMSMKWVIINELSKTQELQSPTMLKARYNVANKLKYLSRMLR